MTPERRQAFLAAFVSSGGSWSAACRAASPHLSGESANPPSSQTWRNLLASDREFAEAFETAQHEVRDAIVSELHRRAIEGVPTPVYQGGRRVTEPAYDANGQPILDPETGQPKRVPAVIYKKSDSALLAMAKAHLEEYRDRKEINISVTRDVSAHWTIAASDLAALDEAQKASLAEIMDAVRSHRREVATLPPAPTLAGEASAPAIEHMEDEKITGVVDENGVEIIPY